MKIYTIAIFADEDRGHSWFADESIELQSAAAFTDIELLVKLAQENTVDSVALGYGFLSESAAFCNALGNVGIRFVGPRSNILEHLGDKSHAKEIATICHVPTLPTQLVSTAQEIESFATSVSYPIIIKALDGGGGRGIRIVSNPNDIENALARCLYVGSIASQSTDCLVESHHQDVFSLRKRPFTVFVMSKSRSSAMSTVM